ncbi:bestrophin-like domain [Halovulum sp. GXIMD14794]
MGLLLIKPLFRIFFGTGPDFNQNLSFGASGFNLFYGLLLGLLTVSAYQNSERVRYAILEEALAVGSLYSQVENYPEPTRSEIQVMLRDYVLYTIHRDWPAHREGEFLDGGANRADAIAAKLANFEPGTQGETVLHQSAVGSFRDFSVARQQRLAGVITKIPDVLWYAVLVGAVVNVLLLCLLRMRPHTQFMVGTITSFFLGVILFVIVTLDNPLRGISGLEPAPFELLWERQLKWDEGQT